MPVKAFPFENLDEKIENVFEAVIIAARRARQINDEQMIHVRTLMEGEDTDEDIVQEEPVDFVELDKLPKPVASALTELLDQKLTHEYVDKE
ncbi:MAG: DNA-directed RNA polymerase subunit omega [Bacteroidetes bacterium]|nr:DNA-directed RNA polymerase subunit omega [Bacteroidota bacterium]